MSVGSVVSLDKGHREFGNRNGLGYQDKGIRVASNTIDPVPRKFFFISKAPSRRLMDIFLPFARRHGKVSETNGYILTYCPSAVT